MKRLRHVDKLIKVLLNEYKPGSRVRMLPTVTSMNNRNTLPPGIFEISIGLSRSVDNKWWMVVLYYMIGDTLICKQNTVMMSYGNACDTFKMMSQTEILDRINRVETQRLYKKHPEYKQIQEILKDVFEIQKAERARKVLADADKHGTQRKTEVDIQVDETGIGNVETGKVQQDASSECSDPS